MKRQITRGVVILSAAAAAALSACGGNDGGNADGDAGGAGGTGDKGDGSGGEEASGGSATGGMSASGGDTGPGGDTSTGGMGGETGTGGSTGTPAESLTVDEACPLGQALYHEITDAMVDSGSTYKYFDRIGTSEFAGFALIKGTSDADHANIQVNAGLQCVVTGDGNDVIEAEFHSSGSTLMTVSGGIGADKFVFAYNGVYPSNNQEFFDIVDFEPGVDKLIFDVNGFDYSDSPDFPISVKVAAFDGDYTTLPTSSRAVIVDPTDGEVWYASNTGEGSAGVIGSISNFSEVSASDIQLVRTVPGCKSSFEGDDQRNGFGEELANYLSASEYSAYGNAIYRMPSDGGAVKVNGTDACVAGSSGDDVIQMFYPGVSGVSGIIAGGAGADHFAYSYPSSEVSNPGTFTIVDFVPGEDQLVFDSSTTSLITGGEGVVIHSTNIDGTSTLSADQVHVDNTDGEVYVTINSAPRLIFKLTGAPQLTATDVVVD